MNVTNLGTTKFEQKIRRVSERANSQYKTYTEKYAYTLDIKLG